MSDLNLIKSNIHNYFWFKLNKYFPRYFTDYGVNETVFQIYHDQNIWQKETKSEIKYIAVKMFNSSAYPQFADIAKQLRNPSLNYQQLLVILYLCIQICRLYILCGEAFAVKYFIIEAQKNLNAAVKKLSSEL